MTSPRSFPSRAAREATYRLGGYAALCALLQPAPWTSIVCPACPRPPPKATLDRDSRALAVWENEVESCRLCQGYGRLTIARPFWPDARILPRLVPANRFAIASARTCAELAALHNRRYPHGLTREETDRGLAAWDHSRVAVDALGPLASFPPR